MESPQTLGEHIRKKRLATGLLQKDVAKEIGVSEDCITFWENGRSIPQVRYYPAIIQFLGYMPFEIAGDTLGGRIRWYRLKQGLSHKRLGKLLSVDASTIRSWEENVTVPNSKNFKKLKELIQ